MRHLVVLAFACGASPKPVTDNHATLPPKRELVYRLPPECHDYETAAQQIAICTSVAVEQRGAIADELDARRRAWANESDETRDNARDGLASQCHDDATTLTTTAQTAGCAP